MTPEQRAAIAQQNGQKGGRPPGSRDIFPRGMINAIKQWKLRVKPEYADKPELVDLANAGLEGYIRVLNGQVHSKRAPSVIKASYALRAELCEPIVQKSEVAHSLSLVSAVEAASRTIEAEARHLPPDPVDVKKLPSMHVPDPTDGSHLDDITVTPQEIKEVVARMPTIRKKGTLQ